jgi:hypothetical protein
MITVKPYYNSKVKNAWKEGEGNDIYICWEIEENSRKKRNRIALDEKFLWKLIYIGIEPNPDSLVELTKEYGPIFKTTNNKISWSLHSSEILILTWFYWFVGGLKEEKGDDPILFDNFIRYFFEIIHRRLDLHVNANNGLKVIYYPDRDWYLNWERCKELAYNTAYAEYVKNGMKNDNNWPSNAKFFLLAVEDEDQLAPRPWPLFKIPPKDLNDTKKAKWLLNECQRNIIDYLKKHITLKPYFENQKGSLKYKIMFEYDDAYTWALEKLASRNIKKCLKCGRITMGLKYCSSKCEKAYMKTASKQKVLDYLKHQQKRNKLTLEQYEFCKLLFNDDKVSNGFFEEKDGKTKMKDSKVLMVEIKNALSNKYQSDFSFLDGYGSKTKRK